MKPAEDPYAAHRCVNCPHLVYENDVPGGSCRWAGMPAGGSGKGCDCTDHRASNQHILIVHDEPDDGMDIEHPPSCPTASIYDGRVLIHTCAVGHLADEWGLDMFFHRDTPHLGRLDSEQVSPGRHPIEVWGDGDLRLVEVPDASSS